jgi:hypothetical protein
VHEVGERQLNEQQEYRTLVRIAVWVTALVFCAAVWGVVLTGAIWFCRWLWSQMP